MPAVKESQSVSPPEPIPEKASVLLVDDRPANLTALEAILEPLGQNLVRANSGREALREVLNSEFAVILMDVEMPEMDGIETAALIREREQSRNIPIIFITAVNTDEHYVFHGYSVGAVDYITKPFNPTVLSSKVSVFVELFQKERLLRERTKLLHEQQVEGLLLKQKERENELEQERIRLVNQMLEHRVQERTAELEAFCYSVSHDLRAPLRAIDGFSSTLVQHVGEHGDAETKDSLSRIRMAAKKMDELITALLALSRITRIEVKPELIDVTALANVLSKELNTPDSKTKVNFKVQDEMKVKGDPQLVRSLLANLISNSLKFTSKKDSATVEVGSFEDASGQLVFYVKDDGEGFNQEYSDKLFRPFERLHGVDEFPGHGIGLATVDRIVRKHGGTAWGEGKVGQGAQFFFTL